MFKLLKCVAAAIILTILQVDTASTWPKHGISSFKNGVLNVAGMDYFTGGGWALNWWRGAGSKGTFVSSINGSLTFQQAYANGTYFNTNAELNNPLPADAVSYERIFFTPVTGNNYQYIGTSFNKFQGEQFNVAWDGCATPTVTVTGSNPGGSSSFGSNSGSVTLGPDASTMANVGLRFTFTAPCYTDPPRNIRVYLARFAANMAAGEITDPEWRAKAASSGFLRLMDVTATNNSGISDASQLADLNYTWYGRPVTGALAGSSSSISGTTLTIVGASSGAGSFAVGSIVVGSGIATNTVITGSATSSPGLCTPNCTGTGGNGTYAVSVSQTVPNIGSFLLVGVPPVGAIDQYGPKGGMAADVACKIANEVGTGIEYPVPAAATDAFVTTVVTNLKNCTTQPVRLSYGNENWNPAFQSYYYAFGRGSSADLNTGGYAYSGYRSAQIFDIAYGIYGQASGQGRWEGALGTQLANPGGVTTQVIAGAKAAIAAGGLHSLTQLASTVTVAPYLGTIFSGCVITGITAAATPTVTASSCGFTNGQLIYIRVTGGTMAGVLNGVYATASSVSGSSFQINISTAGLTYGGSNNFAMPSELFKLIDQSTALNVSTPATYPTKYAYFAQQMSKVTLTGSASDASYGTITAPDSYWLTGSGGAGTNVSTYFSQNAVQALQNGLYLSEYEGGDGTILGSALRNNSTDLENDFVANWQFDNGVVGDSVNTPFNAFTTHLNLMCSVSTGYSNFGSQFNDTQPQSVFGPWGALRFNADTNPKWQAYLNYTNSGRCTDPSPAATGTITYTPGDTYSSNGSGTTDTFSANIGTASTYVIVPVFSQNFPSITSIIIDGSAPLTQLVATPSTNFVAIYGGTVPSGAATRTVTINWSGVAFLRRGATALKTSGLTTAGAISTVVASSLTVAKNQYLVVMGSCGAGSTTNNYTGSTVSSNVNVNDPNSRGAMGLWNSPLPFSTSLFSITPTATGCITVAATFR